MKQWWSRIISVVIALTMLLTQMSAAWAAEPLGVENSPLEEVIEGIILWKKAENGSAPEESFFNDAYLGQAGTTAGDWYPIGMGRFGYEEDYGAYLAMLKEKVQERYRKPEKLNRDKATEWHRISLAVLACGGDPTCFGVDEAGNPINLIADGVYNRGNTASLGRQGINGWIWGLIALDSMRYEIPEGAYYSRADILKQILQRQLPDGGFALTGSVADPDITAMALQALAPYYISDAVYSYRRGQQEVSRTVREVVDEALACLSVMQLENGGYASWGTENVESADQVLVALCSLGIDPLSDARFVKNGNTLLDAILSFRQPDGGFLHSRVYDADNPSSLPNQSNTMAGEQTVYALTALWRQQNGKNALYDFRPEGSADGLPPDDPRSVHADAGSQEDSSVLLYFAQSDRDAVDALPGLLTTENYVTVIKLLDKLEKSEDFEGKEHYTSVLNEAKEQIQAVQDEIDGINRDVLEKLYPFNKISLKDKKTVDSIVSRYERLSSYDQGKILRWDDVVKTKTQVDNLQRAVYIAIVLAGLALILALVAVRRLCNRAGSKKRAMEQLAEQYKDEDL
ncbi:terpene cyclase/mutase family protein [Clostridiaceae bacterium NSJ-31]|uniref:Terpene cyclase/mutase family protein n=1 Tax=Ligaoa zhengdingensis TaxID=2763658 RepID=A0A926E0F0_9FIRM|nr:prenyltransferase/squalene oxidase repeat-containing protein [Ligaoa zhengdingensis]MBC8547122.1 terpene cyclase/mutase family protein [Ligaoa zhengdingensis]